MSPISRPGQDLRRPQDPSKDICSRTYSVSSLRRFTRASCPFFQKGAPQAAKAAARAEVLRHLEALEACLHERSYCFGQAFTVADAYLFCILGWAPLCGIELAAFPSLSRFRERIAAENGVSEALRAEGLL